MKGLEIGVVHGLKSFQKLQSYEFLWPDCNHNFCLLQEFHKFQSYELLWPDCNQFFVLQEFHAKPAPRKIFEGPIGIPDRRPAALVEPHSPSFTLKDRLASRKRPASIGEAAPADEERIIRAKPAPHFGVPTSLQVKIKNNFLIFPPTKSNQGKGRSLYYVESSKTPIIQ